MVSEQSKASATIQALRELIDPKEDQDIKLTLPKLTSLIVPIKGTTPLLLRNVLHETILGTQFRDAAVKAAGYFDTVSVRGVRNGLFIETEGVQFEERTLVKDPVAKKQYNHRYWPWSVNLEVKYITNTFMSAALVLDLINTAGLNGVGLWAPASAKSGRYGQFEIDQDKEIRVIQ